VFHCIYTNVSHLDEKDALVVPTVKIRTSIKVDFGPSIRVLFFFFSPKDGPFRHSDVSRRRTSVSLFASLGSLGSRVF